MVSLNFSCSKDIYIFTLNKFREVYRWRETFRSEERLMVNSYAVFDADKGTIKILNYESVYTSKYITELDAYLWCQGELAVARENGKFVLIDFDGNTYPYDADYDSKIRKNAFPYEFDFKSVKRDTSVFPPIPITEKSEEFDNIILEKHNQIRIESDRIILEDGTVNEVPYQLCGSVGNVVICSKRVPEGGDWKHQLYGICNLKGHIVCEPKYTYICEADMKGNYLLVIDNNKCGLLDYDGKELIPALYNYIDDCDGNVAIVNHGLELIDVNSHNVLFSTSELKKEKGDEDYNYFMEKIVDGWIRVLKSYYTGDSPIGIVKTDGTFYRFYMKDSRWWLSNSESRSGKKYDHMGNTFHDGLLPVYDISRGYGFIDVNGDEIVECKYNEIHAFENGRAKVRYDVDFGYINTKGCIYVKNGLDEIEIPSKYDWAYDFNNGVSIVQKGQWFGCIDIYLNEIIPCVFPNKIELEKAVSKVILINGNNIDYCKKIKELESPLCFKEGKLYGYKDSEGAILCPPILRKAGKFSEGMAFVCIGGKYGYINEKMELIIKPRFDWANDFSEGLALVHEIGIGGDFYINKQGECVISAGGLEELGPFINGTVRCEKYKPYKDNDSYVLTKRVQGYE